MKNAFNRLNKKISQVENRVNEILDKSKEINRNTHKKTG